ncbi:hypothetical protein C8R41DRAFT_864715 [Lentinula lateritia]|uniref:FAD/NAD(P)-binding domain-containing protein n=1 Tax=Lentinula lateritia TaxID=40482 RepID=A0ABQ8VQF3_9AGAR|nr:hypothetical protein C8R41DRAFT_864715 [Lentinula lateritia]
MSEIHNYDVLIVGAGFAGVHQLLNVRKLGLTVKILEAGHGLAGTWYWNRYPGKDVYHKHCLCVPVLTLQCQFSDPEIWQGWTFTEKYPDGREIQAYFQYVDKKFDISRDVLFNSRVVSAHWDDSADRWNLTTEDGEVFRGQFLSLCTGIGSKYYIPEFKGLNTFKGEMHHTARWPETHDYKGKRIGVIGTGATGVQVIQEIAPVVAHLNLTGLHFDINPKLMFDATPEERTLFFEEHWEKGGFHFWMGSYADLLLNPKANNEAYAFWRKKSYYEVYSQPNVRLVDVNKTAIEEITPKGLKTSDGVEHELDVLILATGFDMDGIPIKEKWADGVQSYLGVASATYPNMFWIYGPQSPSSFSNGPSTIMSSELTSDWIIQCIKHMKENNISSIVPTEEAQHAYSELVDQPGAAALWSEAKTSWYMGKNIEGKKAQMLQFSGGIPAYAKLCNDSAAAGYRGFHLKVPA